MAIVEIKKKGKKYYEVRLKCKVKDGKYSQVRRRFLTKKEAQDKEFKLKCDMLDKKEAYSFKEWGDFCLEKIRLEFLNSTYVNYKGSLEKWVYPVIGSKSLKDITPSDVHSLVFSFSELLSSHTRKGLLKNLKRVFQMAVEEVVISQNPALGIKVKVCEVKQKVLSEKEISLLLREAKNCEHRFYSVWVLALLTGMRSGELFALKWTDVDFESGLIHVTKAWSSKNGFGSTKTAKNRVVPLSKQSSLFLKDLKIKSQAREFVLPRLKEWENGEQAKVLKDFCKGLNITPVKFHDLRATFITQMLIRGVSLAKVMLIVGHSSLKTTQGYLRLCGEDVKGATECLNIEVPQKKTQGEVLNLF